MRENTYNDVNDLYKDILSEIKNQGELKGKRREVPFLTFTLSDINKNVLFFPFAQRNWAWILRECSDRLAGVKNPGIAFNYSKNWENRMESDGSYSYHYSDRLNGQMDRVLSSKIHSRDKIISVWKEGDYSIKGRQPCTITMQPLMEHDNTLSMIVYMRNNDMINIFPSDIFIHSTYLKYWATKKKLKYGNIYWVSAVAYYQKKRDALNFPQRLLDQWEHTYESAEIAPTIWNQDHIDDFEKKEVAEELLRSGQKDTKSVIFKTDYIKEWYWITLLYHFKKDKDKEKFNNLYNSQWITEFKLIKNSILPPK